MNADSVEHGRRVIKLVVVFEFCLTFRGDGLQFRAEFCFLAFDFITLAPFRIVSVATLFKFFGIVFAPTAASGSNTFFVRFAPNPVFFADFVWVF